MSYTTAFRWATGSVLVGMAIFSGCDGGAATPESGCARYAAGGCKYSLACVPYTAAFYGSEANCRETLEDVCLHLFIEAGAAEPDQIAACGDAWAAQSCDGDVSTPDACYALGTLGAGAPCSSSIQCKSGQCENIVNDCGTCTTPLLEGDSCDPAASLSCGVQLSCSMSTSTCMHRPDVGEACTDVPCDLFIPCVDGICTAPAGKGEPCGSGIACDLRKGLTCNNVTGLCEDFVVAAVGEPCGTDATTGETSLCAYDARCDGSVCVAAKAEGEACMVDECSFPLECLEGTCAPPTTVECPQPM